MKKSYYIIPKFLYDKKIYEYLKWLTECGIENYNDLKESQEENLSKLILESLWDDFFDVLNLEEDDLPFNENNREKILHSMYKYLRYDIDQLLSEIVEQDKNDEMRFNGLDSFLNNQTGEVQWRKVL